MGNFFARKFQSEIIDILVLGRDWCCSAGCVDRILLTSKHPVLPVRNKCVVSSTLNHVTVVHTGPSEHNSNTIVKLHNCPEMGKNNR